MIQMRDDIPLRGLGPKVFISHSFADQSLAKELSTFLTKNGFRVRMEDETSLVGRHLGEALSRRINDVECFIQLYTENSSQSYWVQQELQYAEEHKEQKGQSEIKLSYEGNELIIIPVVLHSYRLAETFHDLAFIDARKAGLTPIVLENIKEACLQSVRVIHIDDSAPYKITRDEVEQLFSSDNLGKRVIFDAAGYWLRTIDTLIDYAMQFRDDDLKAKRFIAQEEDRRRTIKWMLEIIDVAAEALIVTINKQASKGFIKQDQFYIPLDLFYKIPFFMHFHEILSIAFSADLIRLSQEVARNIDELHEVGFVTTQHGKDKAMAWAFRQALNNTDLSDYSPAKRPLVRLHMDFTTLKKMLIQNAYACYINFPKLVVPYLLGTEALPHPTVKEWAWTLFGLPQAAAYGIDVGAPYERENREVMYSAINSGVGWFLNHYGSISYSEHLDEQTIINLSYWTGKRELIGRLSPPRRI